MFACVCPLLKLKCMFPKFVLRNLCECLAVGDLITARCLRSYAGTLSQVPLLNFKKPEPIAWEAAAT